MTDIKKRHYGRGQGHPTGWTLAEIKTGLGVLSEKHVAICCFYDFIERIEELEAEVIKWKQISSRDHDLYINLLKTTNDAVAAEREWCAGVLDSLKDNEDNKWGGVSVRGAAFRDGAKAIRRK